MPCNVDIYIHQYLLNMRIKSPDVNIQPTPNPIFKVNPHAGSRYNLE